MDGAELTKSELAYLLAVLHATELVGVDDPSLFPTKAKARDSTYGKGRAQLEENGWLEPIPEYTDEYDLNPALLHMVAIVAAPTYVVGTWSGPDEEDRHWREARRDGLRPVRSLSPFTRRTPTSVHDCRRGWHRWGAPRRAQRAATPGRLRRSAARAHGGGQR